MQFLLLLLACCESSFTLTYWHFPQGTTTFKIHYTISTPSTQVVSFSSLIIHRLNTISSSKHIFVWLRLRAESSLCYAPEAHKRSLLSRESWSFSLSFTVITSFVFKTTLLLLARLVNHVRGGGAKKRKTEHAGRFASRQKLWFALPLFVRLPSQKCTNPKPMRQTFRSAHKKSSTLKTGQLSIRFTITHREGRIDWPRETSDFYMWITRPSPNPHATQYYIPYFHHTSSSHTIVQQQQQ